MERYVKLIVLTRTAGVIVAASFKDSQGGFGRPSPLSLLSQDFITIVFEHFSTFLELIYDAVVLTEDMSSLELIQVRHTWRGG